MKPFVLELVGSEYVLNNSELPLGWHTATFGQQNDSPNGFVITFTDSVTLLKVCKVFFKVQQSDWDASQKYFGPFRELYGVFEKIKCRTWNMWKFLLEPCLTLWRSFISTKNVLWCSNCTEVVLGSFFRTKQTRNIFPTCSYDQNWVF